MRGVRDPVVPGTDLFNGVLLKALAAGCFGSRVRVRAKIKNKIITVMNKFHVLINSDMELKVPVGII